jgi:hypothetical protein
MFSIFTFTGLGLSGSCDSDNENNEETDNISTGLTPDGAPDVSEEPVCTRQVFSEECSSKDCSSPEKVPVDQNSELTLTQAEIESTMKKVCLFFCVKILYNVIYLLTYI